MAAHPEARLIGIGLPKGVGLPAGFVQGGCGPAGVVACALLLFAALRRRAPCGGLLLAVLLVLPVSAAITGGLSGPHDRYQARIMWLPPFVAALSFVSLLTSPIILKFRMSPRIP